jgi:hypothetical protein
MNGALRVAALLFGALKIQRWLLCIGGALIAIGLLLPRPAFGVLVLLGVVFALVPAVLAGGVMVRYFVAPRSTRLIPHVRAQVLGGMALFWLAATTALTLALWNIGAAPAAFLPLLGLQIATLATVFLLSQFLLMSSVPGATLWLVGVVGFGQATLSPAVRELLTSIGRNPGLMLAIIVATWGSFALWFLRTPALKGPSDPNAPGWRVKKVTATHEAAVRAFLFGHPSGLHQFFSGLACAGFIVLTWGSLFAVMDGTSPVGDAALKAMGAAMGIGAYAGSGGWLVTRRSKSLWLRGGLDRMGLFRLCEIQAWKYFGATAASMLTVLALAWLLKPEMGLNYTVLLAFHFCAGICLLYFGLMHVRGNRALDLIIGAALFAVWIMSFVMTQVVLKTPWLLPMLVAGMLGAAFVLRLLAVTRWRRIDWLVCKMPRPPARDQVRLA